MRKIIHVDCDCFFAAVEMRERPALRHIPIAIAGDPTRRGVVATCNYPARAFGVRSAMASAHALKLCPQLTLIKGNMSLYKDVSNTLMMKLSTYADVLERVSIDEAYLSIAPELCAEQVAQTIRQDVEKTLGITVSVGVAGNKMLAKIASDWRKPDGLFVIKPHQVDAFMQTLQVRRIPGIGQRFEQTLAQHGIHTCSDAQQWSLTDLVKRFGRSGAQLHQRCRGIDERSLATTRERKSISLETTFDTDLHAEQALTHLPSLHTRWRERVRLAGLEHRLIQPFVKVKFGDFSQTTLSDNHVNHTLDDFQALLTRAMQRQKKAIRLIGIGTRCAPQNLKQMALF